jgi:hypothetical protein
LGAYRSHYANTYFDSTGFGGYEKVIKPGAAEQIQAAVAPLTLRMTAEDYLELPELIGVDPPLVVEVELPKPAADAYRQMEALFISELTAGTVTAANAAVAAMKCRQIAAGGLYADERTPGGKRTWHLVHEAKTDAVVDLVEELSGQPALVVYDFEHDRERLARALGNPPHLGGGVSAKQARETEDAWNAGRLPVLLVHPQSAAFGLNLQGTSGALIFHTLPWALELYEQMIARLWRQGQKERVVVHHVIARGTVDEVVLKTLQKKDCTQKSLLAGLRAYAAQRRPR